jgi:hypothetical protein
VFSAEGSDVSVELNSYRPKTVEKSVEKIVEKTIDRILAQFARDAQIINLTLAKILCLSRRGIEHNGAGKFVGGTFIVNSLRYTTQILRFYIFLPL